MFIILRTERKNLSRMNMNKGFICDLCNKLLDDLGTETNDDSVEAKF